MQVFEFEGKTTEDAITAACRQLELGREEMEIEVVEPGSAGIFGLVGGRKAKIRVSIKAVESGDGKGVPSSRRTTPKRASPSPARPWKGFCSSSPWKAPG